MKPSSFLLSLSIPYKSKHVSRHVSWILLVLATFLFRQSNAFESGEHKLLGDTSIKVIAAQLGCYKDIQADNKDICNILTRIDGRDKNIPSYGDIVACVDYFLTPEKLMSDYEESNTNLIKAWPYKKCDGTQTKYMQASHANHTHFQKELLVSLNTYHLLATSAARDRKNIAGSLFVNAIGDHYLQDFFAPGHITVRRSQITDLFSNALHDGANKLGATFQPGEGIVFEKLKDTIAKIYHTESDRNSTDEISNSICSFLLGLKQAENTVCILPEPVFGKSNVTLQGDHFLNRADGYQQRMLMLAANVISIRDVTSSIQTGDAHNVFEKYNFKYDQNSNKSGSFSDYKVPDILAELPFGFYAMGLNSKTASHNDKIIPMTKDSVWGISIAEEQFSSGSAMARTAVSIEMVPFGIVGNGFFSNYGVAVGIYHYEGSGEVAGNGGSLRIGFIIPETESTLSFGARRVLHSDRSTNLWENGWNVRFDQGYSSFFSLFLSVGKDYSGASADQLSLGNYLSAGIMLAAPTGRIKACIFERCM